MKNWSIQDASAHFGELLEACLREGPQSVTTDGGEAAVLVPIREWRRLQRSAQPALKELLLTDDARAEMLLPARGRSRRQSTRPHA
jgi:prevent-host-death family protein